MPENSQETPKNMFYIVFTRKEFEEFRNALQRGRNALIAQAKGATKDAVLVANNYNETFAQPLRDEARQLLRDYKVIKKWLNKTENAKSQRTVVGVDWAALGPDRTAVIVVRDGIVTTETLPMEFVRDLPTTPSQPETPPHDSIYGSLDDSEPEITLSVRYTGKCHGDTIVLESDSDQKALDCLLDHIKQHHPLYYAKLDEEARVRMQVQRGYGDSVADWKLTSDDTRQAWRRLVLKVRIQWKEQ